MPVDDARKKKFMRGLMIDVVKQIDSGSHVPKNYVDVVQRALRTKSCDRTEPKMVLNKDDKAIEIV